MSMNAEERELMLNPIVPENMLLNNKTISDIRSLTSSIIGIAAGILGLESYTGFLFYLIASSFVSLLVIVLLAGGRTEKYFRSPLWDVWLGDVQGGLSGFILTWTLFYGIVRV